MNKNFTPAEKIIFPCAYIIITLAFIFFKGGVLEFITSLLFLSGVMLNSKGIRFWFLFSSLGVVIYSYVAFNNRFYSEAAINLFFMLPVQLWGFFKWSKDKNTNLKIISISTKHAVFAIFAVALVMLAYGYFLSQIHNAMPYLGALSTASCAIGAFMAGKKIRQQFIFWILNNTTLVVMWFKTLDSSTLGIPILILNLIFIFLNIRGFLNWNRMYKTQEKN